MPLPDLATLAAQVDALQAQVTALKARVNLQKEGLHTLFRIVGHSHLERRVIWMENGSECSGLVKNMNLSNYTATVKRDDNNVTMAISIFDIDRSI